MAMPTVVIAIVALLLLSNIYLLTTLSSHPRPPHPPYQHHHQQHHQHHQHTLSHHVHPTDYTNSIYLSLRRPPFPLTAPNTRLSQIHAFDPVPPHILSRAALETFTGRSPLPTTSHASTNEIPVAQRASRVVFLITPTYRRTTQLADLVRLSQTLQAAAYSSKIGIIYWIVVEDGLTPTYRVRELLDDSGLPYAHLATPSPPTAPQTKNPGRGMAQRNLGLATTRTINVDGVIYFADDDNTYSAHLIPELTLTKAVSVFGVGLVGGTGTYERCHVNASTGRVDALISGIGFARKWGIDMAGFAFSTAWDRRLNYTVRFGEEWAEGELEPGILEQLIQGPEEFEPLAANCTRMLVWHTKTSVGLAGGGEMKNDAEWQYISATV